MSLGAEQLTNLHSTFALLSVPKLGKLHWTSKALAGPGIAGGHVDTAAGLVRRATEQSGWHFYVSLNPVGPTARAKPAKTDITALTCIGLDIDLPHNARGPDFITVANALRLSLFNVFQRPAEDCFYTMIHSGCGLWAWLFLDPYPIITQQDRDEADFLIRGVTEAVFNGHPDLRRLAKCDMACAELSRIARCPGTMNFKSWLLARFIDPVQPNGTLPLSTIRSVASASGVSRVRPPKPPIAAVKSLKDLVPKLNTTSRQFVLFGVQSVDESRHRRLYSTAKNLHELGVSRELAGTALMTGAMNCTPDLLLDDPSCVENVLKQIWGG